MGQNLNPDKISNFLSLQLEEVNRHPWVTAGSKGELELEAPMMEVVQTHIIPTEEFIDDDVLRAMNSLGCFKDKEKLKQELLKPLHNTGEFSNLNVCRLLSKGGHFL